MNIAHIQWQPFNRHTAPIDMVFLIWDSFHGEAELVKFDGWVMWDRESERVNIDDVTHYAEVTGP